VTGVLLDTHAWVWSLTDPGRLSAGARRAIERADAVMVSPISFFEIAQKVHRGGIAAPLTPEICLRAALAEWDHRDPFDRLLAATAEVLAVPLVTRDPAFAGRPGLSLVR
jgi:PIN domain nuclease of toxin-antitoxin system